MCGCNEGYELNFDNVTCNGMYEMSMYRALATTSFHDVTNTSVWQKKAEEETCKHVSATVRLLLQTRFKE